MVEALEDRTLLAAPHPFALSSLNGTNGFRLDGQEANDYSGRAVNNAGDVNGDGFDDIIVGAHQANPNGNDSGAAYMVFGKASGFSSSLNLGSLNGTNGFRIHGEVAGDEAGRSVCSAGDFNGDGFDDLIVGAYLADPNGTASGASYVIFGKSGGFAAVLELSALDGMNGFQLSGEGALDWAGFSVNRAGDVNGDGFSDLLIGAESFDASAPLGAAGAAYVVFGGSGPFTANFNLSALTGANGFRIDAADTFDRVGTSVSPAGDVNGDGFADVIVGARTDENNGTNSGSSYVVFGKASGFGATFNLSTIDGTNGFRLDGAASNHYSGRAVSGAGDINGDGFDDLIVGVGAASPNGASSGSSYVVFGKSTGFSAVMDLSALSLPSGFRIDGGASGDGAGASVSAMGDVNGDGFDDLMIGATGAEPVGYAAGNYGAVYILFGKPSGFSSTVNLESLNGLNGFQINGVFQFDGAGISVGGGGDVNGDGFDDLIIGARDADPNAVTSAGSTYVIFGGNFTGGTETQVGGSGADTLTAIQGAAVDVLVGGRGDDTLISDGGDDILRGGEGDDILAIPDASFSPRRLQGSNGFDTLRLDGAGITLDLTALHDNRITDIEQIDITGTGDNTLILNMQEVLNLSSHSNTLIVRRDAGDTVDMGSGWTQQADEVIGSDSFEVFTQGAATLKVQVVAGAPGVIGLASLDGTNGFRLDGVAAGDQSGFSVSGAGDVNGDGFEDVIVGTYSAGRSYVVFGAPSGFPAALELSTLDGTNGFRIDEVDSGDRGGQSVSGAGDVNGDGFDDLIVGAQRADPGGIANAGESYVVFGKGGGFPAVLDLETLDGTNGFQLDGIDTNDNSGRSVSGAGDVNGDGYGDLIVAAFLADPGGQNAAGETYVVFGGPGGFGSSIGLASLDGANGFRLDGVDVLELSGDTISAAGDVNGDGVDDLLISARDDQEVYVVFGSTSAFAAALDLSTLDGTNGFRIGSIPANPDFGIAVRHAGDVNGDGIDDFVIGGLGSDVSPGASYVIFGASTGFPAAFDLTTLDGSNGFRVDGVDAGDQLGISVSSAGDVNGDGFDDLILGAHYADPEGNDAAGASYLLFGAASGFPAVLALSGIDGTNGLRFDGIDAGDRSGSSVSGAGDVNGDGFDDVIIGASGADPAGNGGAGESYVVFGGNFTGGAETQVGDENDNTLTAALGAAVDVLIGGGGNDTLISDGGDDILRGGEGDDILAIPDAQFSPRRLEGGDGFDTLRLDGAGITLDLTALPDNRITDIEQIDITGTGDNTLILNLQEVLNLSSHSNTVIVRRNLGDVVTIGPGWSQQQDGMIGSDTFEVFTQGAATLKVQSVSITTASVTGMTVNGGDANRSGIRELTIEFDQPVTVGSAGALTLFNHTTGQSVSVSGAALNGGNASPAATWAWVLADGPGGMADIVLADGRYTAELAASGTTPGLAQTFAFEFHKLAGDVDGDALVNFNDYFAVRSQFNASGAAYRPGDADGDGLVNFNDYFAVRANFNAGLAAMTYDFGDAPTAAQSTFAASYPTTLADNGARHVITNNTLFLGTTPDAETNGVPTADALGDDNAGSDDEDGITLGDLEVGTTVGLTVTATVPASAVLNAWIDFNRDGDWDDVGEHVFLDEPIANGANNLSVNVPSGASLGTTFARFRLTQTGGYSFTGLAPNGEVEDYTLNITVPPPPPPLLALPPEPQPAEPAPSADPAPIAPAFGPTFGLIDQLFFTLSLPSVPPRIGLSNASPAPLSLITAPATAGASFPVQQRLASDKNDEQASPPPPPLLPPLSSVPPTAPRGGSIADDSDETHKGLINTSARTKKSLT